MAERKEHWWIQIECLDPDVAEVYFLGGLASEFYVSGDERLWRFEGSPETLTGWHGRANGYNVRFIERVAAPGELDQARADWDDLYRKTNDRICDLLEETIMLRRTIMSCAKASGMDPETIHEIEKLLERAASKAEEKADV